MIAQDAGDARGCTKVSRNLSALTLVRKSSATMISPLHRSATSERLRGSGQSRNPGPAVCRSERPDPESGTSLTSVGRAMLRA